ncbi:MAG: hypothetical protein SFW07_07605 [Gammaproteobacteria bacterium]|nr:hypothetical protein [Gammaproteobacteria bacterium]
MRTETGIMKIFINGFHIEILRIKAKKRRFWRAKIFNNNKRFVKEFFDSNRGFVKFKAIKWIKNKNHQKRS